MKQLFIILLIAISVSVKAQMNVNLYERRMPVFDSNIYIMISSDFFMYKTPLEKNEFIFITDDSGYVKKVSAIKKVYSIRELHTDVYPNPIVEDYKYFVNNKEVSPIHMLY